MIKTFMDKHKLMVFTSKSALKEMPKDGTSRMIPERWFQSKKA